MDQCMAKAPLDMEINVGDEVILIDNDIKELTLEENAKRNDTIRKRKRNKKGRTEMKLTFTEEQIANELHKIYLEEDDLLMEGEFVTGEGKNYIITGVATIEGERYHEFEIEFELTEEPAEETLEAIMQTDWEWYDFLC